MIVKAQEYLIIHILADFMHLHWSAYCVRSDLATVRWVRTACTLQNHREIRDEGENRRTAVTIPGFQYWRLRRACARLRYPMCKLSPCILIPWRSIYRRHRCRRRRRHRRHHRRFWRRRRRLPFRLSRRVCNNSLIPGDERPESTLPSSFPSTPSRGSALQSSHVFDLVLSKTHRLIIDKSFISPLDAVFARDFPFTGK